MDLQDLPGPVIRALFGCPTEEDWASREHGWAVWELTYAESQQFCPEWREHKEAVLRAWIADHPGTRPPIWWRLDAPEERPEDEDQVDFLRRHRLLSRAEERRLAAEKT